MKPLTKSLRRFLLGLGIILLSLRVAPADFVYAANYYSNTITPFDSSGQGSVFASGPLLNGTGGLAFDTSGNLYVANLLNNTVVKFDPSGRGSVFADSLLNVSCHLAFDSSGNLYVSN